ncbi:MAG: tetratricopeptide repeat protein [Candidatus Ratteibacteria bacterium]
MIENFDRQKQVFQNYPESKKYENGLFLLGLLYQQSKKEDEAKKIWEEYFEKYSKDIYSSIIKIFFGKKGEK